MKPLLITHPDCLLHAQANHPERPARLTAVMEALRSTGIARDCRQLEATEVSHECLVSVHPEAYVQAVDRLEASGRASGEVAQLDPDTYLCTGSSRAARLAAGAVTDATRRVLAGEAKRAFCAVRPPGHHAEIAAAMGFCIFNSIAVAAALALRDPGIARLAILDFDVHHCNGTVDIFRSDPRVLVCSSFRDHFYPHRYMDFTNEHIVNTPLTAGTASNSFRRAIERDWVPAIEQHRPDIILVSAGFDAHERDPIGGLALVEEDFSWISALICGLADSYAEGRIVSTLEGGYDLEALASSAVCHVEELLS